MFPLAYVVQTCWDPKLPRFSSPSFFPVYSMKQTEWKLLSYLIMDFGALPAGMYGWQILNASVRSMAEQGDRKGRSYRRRQREKMKKKCAG